MASRKEKFGLILLGIFLGLVVSASFLWWGQQVLTKEWFSFKKIRNAYERLFDSDNDFLAQKKQEDKHTRNSGANRKLYPAEDSLDARLDSLLLTDSSDLTYLLENGALEYYIESDNPQDTLSFPTGDLGRRKHKNDSLVTDSLYYGFKKRQGDFVVKRDEFKMSKTYPVFGYPDSLQKQNHRLDSLLTNNRTQSAAQSTIKVEFWKSPVNYTGYKYSPNRLVLFGSFNPEEIRLEYHNHYLFLRYRNSYYQIETTNDFQSLVSVKHP
jgi:hypothetical protein